VVLRQRMPKACMWVIVVTFTFTLNPIVLIYVMNQGPLVVVRCFENIYYMYYEHRTEIIVPL